LVIFSESSGFLRHDKAEILLKVLTMIEPKYGSFGINETITHSPSIQSHKNKCKSFFLETKLGKTQTV
jgi:hypothetical protein